jgi:ribosomal protein S18 acetylase RimI-like enzyme
MRVTLSAITNADRDEFLQMAEEHFRGLNPAFVPHADWKQHYFERIQANSRLLARWITVDGRHAGFTLFGIEDHRFLPRLTAMIYELFVLPEFRRMGVARACAKQAISELQALGPSKVQLEVMEGNEAAKQLWLSMGFRKVSERYVLSQEPS